MELCGIGGGSVCLHSWPRIAAPHNGERHRRDQVRRLPLSSPIKNVCVVLGDDSPQPHLSLDERQLAQIFTIQPQEIEGIEEWLIAPKHQVVERGN